MRNAAAEFDDFKPPLYIALGVGNDLAMLAGKQVRQLIHVCFDQSFEIEHDACAPLRVGCGPGRLCCKCGLHRAFKNGCISQGDLRLHSSIVGIEDIAEALRCSSGTTGNKMINLAHNNGLPINAADP